MQIIAYPIALRTTLANLQLARETHRISETDYQSLATQAIADAKAKLVTMGSPMDDSWTDTGADGNTPIPFIDNPQGLTMIWYKAVQL